MDKDNEYFQVAKSIVLVCYWGTKSLTWNVIMGLAMFILGVMILISAFYPDNPVRAICIIAGVFSVYFGNRLLLKK